MNDFHLKLEYHLKPFGTKSSFFVKKKGIHGLGFGQQLGCTKFLPTLGLDERNLTSLP